MTAHRCALDEATLLELVSKTDPPSSNGGRIQFDRSLRVRATDGGMNVSVDAIPLKPRQWRHAAGAGIELTAAEASDLRDALSAWLENTAQVGDSP